MNNKNKINKYYIRALICTILLACGIFMTSNSYPLFYEPFMEVFNASRSEVTLHTSINFLTFSFGSLVAVRLLKKMKLRYVMIIGLIFTAGSTMLEAVCTSLMQINILNVIKGFTYTFCGVTIMQTLIGNWFYKYRGLVMGLAFSISGLAAAIYTPILASVITNYGYRFGLVFSYSILALLTLPTIFLCPYKPEEVGLKAYGYEETTNVIEEDSYKIPFKYLSILVLMYLVNTICMSFLGNYSNHINGYATSLGFDLVKASTVLSAFSIGSVVSNIFAGILLDKLGVKKGTIITSFISILGVFLMFISSGNYVLLLIGSFLFGTCQAAGNVCGDGLIRKIYGSEQYHEVMAKLLVIISPINSISITLISLLYDATGSYNLSLIITMIGGVFSVILTLLMLKRAKTEYQKNHI